MTFYTAITGLTALLGFGLGGFVFWHKPHTPLKTSWVVFSCTVSSWSLGYFISLLAINYPTSVIFSRLSHACGSFIPITFLYFVLILLHLAEKKKKLLFWGYVYSAFLLICSFTPLVVRDVIPKRGIPFYPDWGIFYPLYAANFLAFIGYSYFLMARAILHLRGLEQRRVLYLFIAALLGFSGGISLFLLIFNIPLPPYGSTLICLYPIIMSYSIVKHRLMDIEVIIKKTLVFTGLFSFFYGLFAFFSFLMTDLLQQQMSVSLRWWLLAFATAIVALTSRRLELLLVGLTDRYLFQKETDYKAMLKDASRQIASIKSLKRLSRLVVAFLVKRARIKNVAVFICSTSGNYELLASRPVFRLKAPMLNEFSPIIARLETVQQPIEKEEVKKQIESGTGMVDCAQLNEVLCFMDSFHAEAIIPSYLGEIRKRNYPPHRMLRSFLLLGSKKSDQEYSQEDLDVFFTLAQETAVAVENARLYDEAIERNLELQRINQELMDTQSQLLIAERKATMVGFAKAIGHEVNNALVSIDSGAMFARRDDIPELKQIYESQLKDKLPLGIQRKFEKLVDNLEKRAVKSSNGSHRIQVVIQTLTNILKETREGFEEVNFRMLWEEAVAEVNLSTYEENLAGCKIESDIPKNLILRVNQGQIQRVLVNLIKNAYEAMSGVPDRRICVRASYDPDPQFKGMAHIEVEDNGPGIPEELIAKVFAQGFSTKPKPKAGDLGAAGQGQGLFVCKHIVESAHKGTIEVQSTQGQGTAFILRLPAVGSEDAEENPGIG